MEKQAAPVGRGHDAPIEKPADDLLDGLGVARAIHRFLRTTPPGWSTRIGLFGRWGSGKTSILNLLRTLEEADGALVIGFSAWSASGEAGVIEQFYATLSQRVQDEQIELPKAQRAKQLGSKVRKFSWLGRLGATAAEELTPLPPVIVKAGVAALDKLGTAATAWTKVSAADLQSIASLLQGRRVVVFIDDLDRADPKLIPKTLLALRELLDWPGFAFVLAFDKRAVASALASYSTAFGEDADGFLEKVIDVPFEVPAPSKEHRGRLARAAFHACCDLMPQSSIDAIAPHLPSQPRRVKIVARMMGSLGPSLARHAVNDVDWMGLALYLILKEARADLADWVMRAVSDEKGDWLSWGGGKEQRKQKEEEVRARLFAVLTSPNPPDDAHRIIDAAVRLIEHWRYLSSEAIAYWSRLVFKEPAITMAELLILRDGFAAKKDHQLIDAALSAAATHASVSVEQASAEILQAAINCYGIDLDAMASSRTISDQDSHRQTAERSLLLLEQLYGQSSNRALAASAAEAAAVIPILGLVSRWIGWTRNVGEAELRKRERELALTAIARNTDPDQVFLATDPFNHGWHGQDAATVRAWHDEVRASVGPLVVTRLCARFREVDGMVPIASGNDQLGPWLVESTKSPLYTVPALTGELLATLRSGVGETDAVRSTLSKNAGLFLRQILFQTRDASWGEGDAAKIIHGGSPLIVPAAWKAVVDVQAPFRGLNSLRQLRRDLVKIGVAEGDLPMPPWLEEPEPTKA